MKYTIENFKDGEFNIHCGTNEEADSLMELLHNDGITWCTCQSLLSHNNWCEYKDQTCYAYNNGLSYGNIATPSSRKIILFQEFFDVNKSNKEKVLELIGIKKGEPFNMIDDRYNPYCFDDQFVLRDKNGTRCTSKVIDILWGNSEVEKLLVDKNAEIKKCIELLSGSTVPVKSIIDCVRTSLTEILELKESKSV